MNPGKRYLRNTVFALWGAAAFFVGLNRLYAAVGVDAPEWRRNLLSLGLRAHEQEKQRPEMDLATAKDFSKVSLFGNFTVEIVGAQQYSVTFTPLAGATARAHAYLEDGTLHVHTEDSVTGGVLRIEVPTLERIDANVAQITVRGVQSAEVAIVGYRGGVLTLQQNQVKRWRMFSGDPLDVRVDDATFAAGSIKANGDVVIRRDQ